MPLLLATFAMFTTPMLAEPEWYRVNAGKQTAAYVVRNNIAIDGDLRTASVATVRAAPMLENGAVFFITKQVFNCATGQVSDLKITYLGATGNLIGSKVPPAGFHDVFEGTNLDFAKRFVCAGTGGTRVADPKTDAATFFQK